MTKEISTKITRLDLDFILSNCFKPYLWKHTWTIFAYDGWEVKFYITRIDTRENKMWYTIELYKDGHWKSSSTYNYMNFLEEHRNLTVLQNELNGVITKRVMEYAEQNIIRETQAYKEAKEYEDELLELAKEAAENLLDELNITNNDIRDAYIDSQTSNAETSEYTTRILTLYRGTKLTKLYLAYCLFADDKKRYEDYKKIAKANGFKIGETRKEIKSDLAKIESGEMYDELYENLEKI